MAGLHVGYGKSFEDDELTDAAETARILGARHLTVKLDQSRVRTISSENRGMFGGACRGIVDRSDVLRFPTRAAGCESRVDRPGAGRIVRRL